MIRSLLVTFSFRNAKCCLDAVLEGAAALELFLKCYQLLLWKQTAWLIRHKKYPQELQDVVRNQLWSRRLQLLEDAGVFKRFGAKVQYDHVGQLPDTSAIRKDSRVSQRWPEELPTLEDTLSMLYLSMIYMRLPTTVADARNWVTEKDFPFLRAEDAIPPSMMDKLPLAYRRTFHAPVRLSYSSRMPVISLDIVKILDSC